MSHATDQQLRNRLRRAQGHLAKIVAMVEDNRDALETAQQLQAVVSALEKAKIFLVTHHIEHHLMEAVGPLPKHTKVKLARLTELARYL